MTVDDWLEAALADADRRGLTDLKGLLENLARATASLRAAPWNPHAAADVPSSSGWTEYHPEHAARDELSRPEDRKR